MFRCCWARIVILLIVGVRFSGEVERGGVGSRSFGEQLRAGLREPEENRRYGHIVRS